MANPEWGKKRICLACNTKYYDFNKSPIICPSCGTEFDPDKYLKIRKGKGLLTKVVPENNQNMSEEMSNIDDVEIDNNEEVVTDDDPLLEINKHDQRDDYLRFHCYKNDSCPQFELLRDSTGEHRGIEI